MHIRLIMKCTTVKSLCLTTITALVGVGAGANSAHADGYIGMGVQGGVHVRGGIADHLNPAEGSGGGRLMIGQRLGALALEASFWGTNLDSTSGRFGQDMLTTTSIGVGLKYYLPLALGIELYGKAGLNKTWILPGKEGENAVDIGRGYDLGGGLQYSFPVPIGTIALWADVTDQQMTLERDNLSSSKGHVTQLNLGASLGF